MNDKLQQLEEKVRQLEKNTAKLKKSRMVIIALSAVLVSFFFMAAVTLPNTISSGDPMDISKIMENFNALKNVFQTDPGYVPYDNGSNQLANSPIYVDGSGNVGIGTSSPTKKLEISNGSLWINEYTGDESIILGSLGSDRSLQLNIDYGQVIGSRASHVLLGKIIAQGAKSSGWYSSLGFYTSQNANDATLKMIITDTGKVGIGTENPDYNLEVNGNLSATNYYAGGSMGVTTTFTDNTGKTVTVTNGIITGVN